MNRRPGVAFGYAGQARAAENVLSSASWPQTGFRERNARLAVIGFNGWTAVLAAGSGQTLLEILAEMVRIVRDLLSLYG